MSEKKGVTFSTVDLSSDGQHLVIIDQTLLPGTMKLLELRAQEDIREAIYLLKVRGAPAIGVAAAIGLYLAALDLAPECGDDEAVFFEKLAATYDAKYPTITAVIKLPNAHANINPPCFNISCIVLPSVCTNLVIFDI